MKTISKEKGLLSVDLGNGWLSGDEAKSIKKNDIVRINSFAGDSQILRFNGHFMASCEMVILGDIWGVRIVNYDEPPVRHRMPPVPGALTEVLPVSVRLGSVQMSLEELEPLCPGSIISLGKKYSEEEDAELLIAGIPAAKGKVVILWEELDDLN